VLSLPVRLHFFPFPYLLLFGFFILHLQLPLLFLSIIIPPHKMWTSPSPDDEEHHSITGGSGSNQMARRKRQTLIFAFVAWNLLIFLLAVIALSKEQKSEINQYNTKTVSYQLAANLTIGSEGMHDFSIFINLHFLPSSLLFLLTF
jgi:hypothetical protein